MDRWIAALIIFASICAHASEDHDTSMETGMLCSNSWCRLMDDTVGTSDNQGHGPDIGSDEWKSVIEFKLGIRGDPNLPDRGSEAWCRLIDQIVRERYPTSSQNNGVSNKKAIALGPSFNCDDVAVNSIEEMICTDDKLSALDRKLSIVFSAATRKAANEHPPMLKAEQRGWINPNVAKV